MTGMYQQFATDMTASESVARIEGHVRCRLIGRVRDFRLIVLDQGLILRGRANTYHAKQLAQQAVMEASSLPIRVNEIEVTRTGRDGAGHWGVSVHDRLSSLRGE